MDPLQLSQQQQQLSSRERRKKALDGKKICVTTNINTHTSKVNPKPKHVTQPLIVAESLLQQSNAAAERENRKRVLYKNKVVAASKKVCVPSHKQAIPKPFNVIRNLPEVAAISREKRKRYIQENKFHVPSAGPANPTSISKHPLQSNVIHYQKENSTTSRDNRKRVLSEKRTSPSNGIHNTPTTSKNTIVYTTPLSDITNAQQFFFPKQSHATNSLSQNTFTQPNDQIHSKMSRQSKSGINLLSKFAATAHPLPTSQVEPDDPNANEKSPETSIPSNSAVSTSAHESFDSNTSSDSDTDDSGSDSEEHTESDSDSEDDISEENINFTNIQLGEPALQGKMIVNSFIHSSFNYIPYPLMLNSICRLF
jgi:hypothetical protein